MNKHKQESPYCHKLHPPDVSDISERLEQLADSIVVGGPHGQVLHVHGSRVHVGLGRGRDGARAPQATGVLGQLVREEGES